MRALGLLLTLVLLGAVPASSRPAMAAPVVASPLAVSPLAAAPGVVLPVVAAPLVGAPVVAAPAVVLPVVAVPASAGPAPRAPVPVAGFGWPLDGTPTVVRRFDPPPQRWLAGHRGVDLSGEPGAPVRAAGAGTVVFAGMLAGRGVVSIDHPNGLRTTYEPVVVSVTAGAAVAQGTPIGALAPGHAGCPVPACLHWGLRRGATYLDPLLLLGFVRVRLLPLD